MELTRELVNVGLVLAVLPVVTWVLSIVGGWSRLAAVYPCDRPRPPAATWLGYAMFRGWVRYNGGVIAAADADGLYLSTWPILLSWCNPPLFIPWEDVAVARERRWFGSVYALTLAGAPEVPVALRAGTFEAVAAQAAAAGRPIPVA